MSEWALGHEPRRALNSHRMDGGVGPLGGGRGRDAADLDPGPGPAPSLARRSWPSRPSLAFTLYAGPPMARGIIVVAVPALVAVTFVLWV